MGDSYRHTIKTERFQNCFHCVHVFYIVMTVMSVWNRVGGRVGGWRGLVILQRKRMGGSESIWTPAVLKN